MSVDGRHEPVQLPPSAKEHLMAVSNATKRATPEPITACCAPITAELLDEDDAITLAAGFKVLADPARLRLLSLLAAQPEGEACVCDLTEPLGLTQPTVSHHLRLLHGAGLVTRDKRGTFSYYRIAPERLAVLRAALDVTG
jgi:ArsR family transcriptional regulator, arsenate/arsenite/antimonite-responsive transcriptional repressor